MISGAKIYQSWRVAIAPEWAMGESKGRGYLPVGVQVADGEESGSETLGEVLSSSPEPTIIEASTVNRGSQRCETFQGWHSSCYN